MYELGTYPFKYTLAIVGFINIVVLGLTYALFYKLRSTAAVKTTSWQAGGAIAGFVILTGLELYLMDHFSPTLQSRPSYGVVRDFYGHLQYRRYADAWNLLHPSFRAQKWHGDFETFRSGYEDTLNIGLLAIILERAQSPASDDYIVYYVDEVNSPVLPGLERVLAAPIKNFVGCSNSVDQLRERLRSAGYDVDIFDNIAMRDLLAPDRGARIGWILDHQSSPKVARKKFDELYPVKQKVEFISAFRVTTQYTDKGWQIAYTGPLEE